MGKECLLGMRGRQVCSRQMLMFCSGGGQPVIVIVQLQSFHYSHHCNSSLISSFRRGSRETYCSYSLNQRRFFDLPPTIRSKACLISFYQIYILFLEPMNATIIRKGMNKQPRMLQTRTRLEVETSLDQKKRATIRKKKKITMVKQERRALQISKHESQQQSSGFPSKRSLCEPIFLHPNYLTSNNESIHSPSCPSIQIVQFMGQIIYQQY